ncbi:inactive peptidyl-prolyl cis-trans isomerase shutdown-like [Contarinia nasturtii]|uniref:inactive peptidyl-prolyl cis-trans isomerase shutdown-like n=1 Tax=Contarinia nasturtii TaxID=265458 RepID=UPI0012D38294|nr:inactive peptidyl-prolyl cis-trans isomerase shutdown-like [Contarinia nasturtii]
MANEMEKTIELENAIRFKDLLSTGSNFKINQESMAETIDQEIFDDAGSDDDDGELDEDFDSKLSPWKKSFTELKTLMVNVPNKFGSASIYKRIISEGKGEVMQSYNCRIEWTFSMFFENESNAFDSKTKPITAEISEMLIGIQIAVKTMRKKEEAQFVIDYKLMFGEMGCPPRIKPKSDVLLVAKLISFDEIGDEHACDEISEEDQRKFHVIKDKIDEIYKKSLDHIKNKRYRYAITASQTALRKLEWCQVADEKEETEQQSFINKLYIQLADCYIQVENWKKCCLMINELRRRSNISQNVSVMLNEAIALSNIEETFGRSIKLLRAAQQIEPQNEMVNKTLAEILEKDAKYKKEQQEMWKRALDLKAKVESLQK